MLKPMTLFVLLSILCLSHISEAGTDERVSIKGLFILNLQINPDPPRMGVNNTAILTVHERDSKTRVQGAIIEVIPWMTVHSHGSPKKTRISEKGNGIYLVDDMYFTMEGEWDIIVRISKDKKNDEAVFTFSKIKK